MDIHKPDIAFVNRIPQRFHRDAIQNGMNRSIDDTKERKRRQDHEETWIGNPQYGPWSMLLGFSRKAMR